MLDVDGTGLCLCRRVVGFFGLKIENTVVSVCGRQALLVRGCARSVWPYSTLLLEDCV